jgi:16S rRNA (guanine527-N7)-methyltransferase
LDIRTILDEKTAGIWKRFVAHEKLTEQQEKQFAQYITLLIEWSEKINLTTIKAPTAVIRYHFQDSLQLGHVIDLNKEQTIVDVGSGGGFPGIPLAIKYPDLHVVLVEVSQKKVNFLDTVISALKLKNIEIYTQDWRTFLRQTDYPANYICARASLQPEELIRMFKPASPYKEVTLVYWAATQWAPEGKVIPFVQKEFPYSVGNRKHKLVFFKK